MNGKLYIKKFIRDDGETLSFDAEEIYLSENNTLLVRSDPATTAVEFTEEDGGEMIRQRGSTYSQPVSGLIVPKSTEYWALCVRLSRFFILNHTYKIVYIKRDGSMFSMNRAWINAGLQIVPVPYESYSTWTIEFRIGDNFWTEYAEDGQGKEIYSNTVELPLLTAGTGGEVWSDAIQQTLSGLGNYFAIDGTSISASINKLELKGDTFQQTYTGKNLSPYPYSDGGSKVIRGITFTAASDGSVTLNGTNDGNANSAYYIYYSDSQSLQFEAGTYYFIPPSNTNVGYVMYDGTRYYDFNNANNYSQTFSSAKNIRHIYIQVRKGNTTTFNNLKIYPMLTTLSNPTESDYEPYVGGIPAPSPDYPQDIHVVTGEQVVEVHGKNLFNSYALAGKTLYPNGNQINIGSDGTITLTGNTSSNGYCRVMNTPLRDFCPKLEVGKIYYLYLSGNNITANQIYLSNSDFHWGAGTSRTITQSDLDGDIVVYGGYNTTTTIKIMITETQDSNYEPYQSQTYTVDLGSIELCKIGDYQDKIYKSGDDWYVHKEFSNYTFDGTEADWGSDTSGGYFRTRHTLSGVAAGSNRVTAGTISNYFTVSTENAYGICFRNQNNIYFYPQSSITTLADFKTWLSSHNTTVYYALATPTNIQIENPDLVAQLNALAGAQAYNGKTVYQTNSATMPAILSVELLQSVGGGEVWDNVGAVWEEGVGGVQTINVETTQTTYPVWTVTGPCSNPTLQNDTTDTLASFDGMIASGQTLTVNFADNTAYLDSAPVAKYVSGYVSLAPGENVIGFNSDGGSTQTSTISWDNIIN